jgi:hypothetical protein
MKRTAAAVLCLLLCATAASADEAFLLNIPLRFNASQETGEVRITLTLAAAPAGSQLVVNNATTLNLGATQTIAGDSVTFTAGAGNSVRIVYAPLSNFGADFCTGGSAVEKNIPLRFIGPDITKYHITSYVVAAPSAECSKVSKRTGDMPAVLVPNDDGVAPALNAQDGGRHPLDVAVVLDQSGSMNEFPPDAISGSTKAQILRSAMTTLVATWSEMDVVYPEDRIGIVFFSNSATPQTFAGGDPPANFFVQRGTDPPGPSHDWHPLGAGINALTPGGSTSIGAGLNAAMTQWTGDPDNDLAILVVTDGKQNTAPLLQTAPSGFLSLPPVGGLPAELRQRFIPIQSVGFNTPGAVDGALLTNMALETSGVSYIGIDAATMFDTLAMTLIAILKGNTASMALRHHDTFSAAAPPQPVPVDASVERATFSVQWAPPAVNRFDLEVLRPDGSVAQPDSASKTPQASLQSFNMNRGDIGTWRVRVKQATNLVAATRPIPYTLHVYFMERHLDFTVSLDPPRPATGDTVTIRAQVAYEGRPLNKLPAGAIKVRVQRPAEGLGTILRKMPLRDGAAPSGDTQNAYQSKVSQLPKGVLSRVMPADVETITLVGGKNGVYTGTFTGTSVPGQYGFETLLDWTDTRTGRLRREERLETDVKVRPDPAATQIVTSGNVQGVVTVSVTPRDRFRNFLGPGYAPVIRAKLIGNGRLDPTPVDREQTGTYVFTIRGVPAGETPRLEISVDGVPLRGK